MIKRVLVFALLICGLLIPSIVSAADEWHSPDSDIANGWSNPAYAYDDNTSTYAWDDVAGGDKWSPWLELHLDVELLCTKVRIWGYGETSDINEVKIGVYYGGVWHEIYNGVFDWDDDVWVEYLVGSEQEISAMRVSYFNDHFSPKMAYVREGDFWGYYGDVAVSPVPVGEGFGGWMIALIFCIIGLSWYLRAMLLGIVGCILCIVSYVWVGGFLGSEIGVYGASGFFLIMVGWIILNLIWRETRYG